ncbi:hypothetical protein NLG97_g3313 [Lecanicillium saksenae]|uniref:Uncharacterized protein n=1 Tax=Lecanicillium saksenae TaxID=468837 RepID=A0ACC1QZN4_9HYPO|nr:hypothetical protein NLG97_g3313 [Lecanicillium saksenae]
MQFFLAALSATQVANLAIWATTAAEHRTSTTLPAVALDLMASLSIGIVAYAEHFHSIGSNTLLTLFLLLNALTDVTRSRSFFLRDGLSAVGSLAIASAATKLILVGLREIPKKSLLIDDNLREGVGPEATGGFLGKLFIAFGCRIFAMAFCGQTLYENLNQLGPDITPEILHKQLTSHWHVRTNGRQTPRHHLFVSCLKTWKYCLLRLILCRLVLTAFNFSQPFILYRVIELVGRAQDDPPELQTQCGLFGASSFAFYGIAFSRALFARQMNRLVARLRGGLLSLLFHKGHKLTELEAKRAAATTLISTDIDGIASGVPRCLEIPINMAEIALSTYLLSKFTGVSALTVLTPLGIITVVFYLFNLRLSLLLGVWDKRIELRTSNTSHILSQLTNIKALGLGTTIALFLQQLRIDEIKTALAYRRLQALSKGPAVLGDLIAPVVVVAAALFGGSFRGEMEAAKVFPVLSLVSLIQRPLLAVLQSFPTVLGMLACFSRVQNYLCLPDRKDCRATLTPASRSQGSNSAGTPQSNGIIHFNHVDIAPYGKNEAILRNVNFRILARSITAVVGLTGAGKSTLLHGILGGAEVLDGSIKVGTTNIGYCGQVVWLRDTSIRANIIGHLPYNRAKFRRVIRACFLDQDLRWLPGGEDFIVGPNGSNLSGGQRHRIAIARTAYAACKITLLDDPFSSLDSETAVTILYQLCGQNGLLRRAGCTALVVTYLPDCMKVADQALYLDNLGNATLKSIQQLSEYTDRLMVALGGVNSNVTVVQETRELGKVRRSLKTDAPRAGVEDTLVRQGGALSIYSIFLRPIGWFSSMLYTVLVFLASAVELMPEVCIRIWIELDPTNSSFFIGYSSIILGTCFLAILHYWLLYTQLSPRASASLHRDLVQATIGSTVRFLSTTKIGNIIHLYSQDMTAVSRDLPAAFLSLLYAGTNFIVSIGIVATGATYLFCAIPVLLGALYFIQRYYMCTSQQLRRLDLEMRAPLNTYFQETAAGLTHIQAFGWVSKNIEDGFRLLQESQKPYHALLTIQQWLRLVLGLFNASLGTSLVGVTIFARHTSSQSAVGLAFMGLIYISIALEMTINAWTRLEDSSSVLERISSFKKRTPQETITINDDLPRNWPSVGQIELRNVSAHYSRDPEMRPALENVSLSVYPGQRVGITGRSGSGKTSLLLTMLGFLEYDGRLEIDGVNIASVPYEELRSRLIIVTQDQVLFNASIRTNLLPFTMNDGETKPEEHDKVAKKDLELEQLLQSLHIWTPLTKKRGLHSILDDVGYSKGQLQMLCIARAILRHRETGSKIVLLDEATSSIDASTEEIVQRVMSENFSGCTVLTVGHRQSNLQHVNGIVRLHRGAVVTADHQQAESEELEESEESEEDA